MIHYILFKEKKNLLWIRDKDQINIEQRKWFYAMRRRKSAGAHALARSNEIKKWRNKQSWTNSKFGRHTNLNRKSGRNDLTDLKMGQTIFCFMIFSDFDGIFHLNSLICRTLCVALLLPRTNIVFICVLSFGLVKKIKWKMENEWDKDQLAHENVKEFLDLCSASRTTNTQQPKSEWLIYRSACINIARTRSICLTYLNLIYRKTCASDVPWQIECHNYGRQSGQLKIFQLNWIVNVWNAFGTLCHFLSHTGNTRLPKRVNSISTHCETKNNIQLLFRTKITSIYSCWKTVEV